MTDTDKNPARSFLLLPVGFFISTSGYHADVLLHADSEPDQGQALRSHQHQQGIPHVHITPCNFSLTEKLLYGTISKYYYV
ncbi:MAG: hypothetical protein IKD50_09290, partial [Clostridia bacterium]|nr:hypothetical protein [Clostridia bacterium]